MKLPKSLKSRIIKDSKEIDYVEAKEIKTEGPSNNNNFTAEQKTKIITSAITEGAKLANKVLDIIEHRVKADDSLRQMDKQIELVQKTTEAEINKMYAETNNWEKRLSALSKILKEMIETITENKNLDPQVAKSIIETVKTMIEKM